MTTTQKLLGGGLLFLGGVGLTLLFQATRPHALGPVCSPNTDCTEVRIRLKHGGPDCDVDNEEVHIRTAPAAAPQQPDQIYWCVRSDVTTQYSIHFTNNSGNNSPFPSNDFLANKTDYGQEKCSDLNSPAPGKPTGQANPFKYQILYTTSSGISGSCSDPMVILK